ncbi:MAG: HAMP domain-containing protein [Spirochaetia bacterium]|nr:HAMP domain-containing protein [Spirochaetia bacterium]
MFQKIRSYLYHFRIRTKLITVISLLVGVALIAIIFAATYFFKRNIEGNINVNNLSISELLALNVRNELTRSTEKLNLLGDLAVQDVQAASLNEMRARFFVNDPSLIYAGVSRRIGTDRAFPGTYRALHNDAILESSGLSAGAVESIIQGRWEKLLPVLTGEAVILNVSDAFKTGVFFLALPFQQEGGRVQTIAWGFFKSDPLQKLFKKKGITETFLVDSRGDVIAHTDEAMVLSRANLQSLAIVEVMLRSKQDNRNLPYTEGKEKFIGSFKKIPFAGLGVVATVPTKKAFEEVDHIQRRNIYLTVLVLSIAVLIGYFFAKTLSSPIITLAGATKQVESGNFDVDVPVESGDEVGELTTSFNAMTKGLKERERLKSTLGRFVNKEIAEMAAKGELKLGGERRDAAVFFSDIRSFTAISEKLQPEEVVEFLNQYFTRMVTLVHNHHGSVDKFIGDAIMALWGVPSSHGNDCENAIRCSLEMRKNLNQFNLDREKEGKFPLKIGMGINYGPLLSGQIGSEDHISYTVIGDTVNLASRIEALNKPFGTDILITEDAYQKTKGLFTVEPMKKITVKGKAEPQQIYAVVGEVNDPSAPKTIEEVRALLGTHFDEKKASHTDEEEVKYEIVEG